MTRHVLFPSYFLRWGRLQVQRADGRKVREGPLSRSSRRRKYGASRHRRAGGIRRRHRPRAGEAGHPGGRQDLPQAPGIGRGRHRAAYRLHGNGRESAHHIPLPPPPPQYTIQTTLPSIFFSCCWTRQLSYLFIVLVHPCRAVALKLLQYYVFDIRSPRSCPCPRPPAPSEPPSPDGFTPLSLYLSHTHTLILGRLVTSSPKRCRWFKC